MARRREPVPTLQYLYCCSSLVRIPAQGSDCIIPQLSRFFQLVAAHARAHPKPAELLFPLLGALRQIADIILHGGIDPSLFLAVLHSARFVCLGSSLCGAPKPDQSTPVNYYPPRQTNKQTSKSIDNLRGVLQGFRKGSNRDSNYKLVDKYTF